MHEGCGVDVTSPEFEAEIARYGRIIADEGWYPYVEINISRELMPANPATELTLERTNEELRYQQVMIVPRTAALMDGADRTAACWLEQDGVPVVRGVCKATNHDH